MDEKIKLIANSFGLEKVKFNESLSQHTALKVGGQAKLFAVVVNERELVKLIEDCVQLKMPFMVSGTGSKIIISDSGFEGVFIKNRLQNIKIISIKGKVGKSGLGVDSVLMEVESGVEINKLIEFLEKQGLENDDLKNLSGSIGGNLFINPVLRGKTESIKVLNLDSEVEIIPIKDLKLREHVLVSVVLKVKAK